MSEVVLRGERYLTTANEKLARVLLEDVPNFDMVEALKFYQRFIAYGRPKKNDLALMGCNDRFFLLACLLGRMDAAHPWLYARCREVEAKTDHCLDLWSRDHYKSTIITYAGSVQEILCNPEITIGLFSFNQSIARAFLSQIMREFERNDRLKDIYSDVLWSDPKTESPKWARDQGIIVKRKTNPKEATIEAHGLVDGQPTSRHYELMIYDDVVTRESVTTPEQIKKTTEAFELSDNLSSREGRRWMVGTRYHFGDTWGVILERGIAKPRIYPATHNGKMDGRPVFLTQKRWDEKKRTQRSTLAAQMLQNPLAGKENTFQPAWFRPYQVRPSILNVYIMADPSRGRGATSDRTAIAVIGIDAGNNKYLLDGYAQRMKLSERWVALRDLHKKWSKQPGVRHVKVGYERFGQQSDDEYLQEQMEREGYYFPIEELAWPREGGASKQHRVERLQPDLENSAFFLPAVVWHPDVDDRDRLALWSFNSTNEQIEFRPFKPTRRMIEIQQDGQPFRVAKPIKRADEDKNFYDLTREFMSEARLFPFSPHDDLVDAVSRIYDMDPRPPLQDERVVPKIQVFDDT